MLSIAVKSNRKLEVTHIAQPKADANSVIVKVHFSGLCGSDLPRIFYEGAHFYPIVLGHEFSGEVVEVGQSVTGFKIGDRIACAPLIPCKQCKQCKEGNYSLCPNYSFVGSRVQGGNAEFVNVPSQCCFKLDDTVTSLEGAFFEPLTVSLHPILMADGCDNKNVVVVGVGTIGLLAVQAAKALGAATVTAIDIDDDKLAKAKLLGADFLFNSSDGDMLAKIKENKLPVTPQLILETAGHPQTVKLCINIADPKATIALIGTLHEDLNMSHQDFGQILRKELKLFGSWMNYSAPYPGKEWDLAKSLFSQGLIKTGDLIDGVYSPNHFVERVTGLQGKSPAGKILLDWSQSS
ncbi:alcohol dehydrogenase catalytic domain-containing protein [Vibrio sp. ZSDZ65]|uniref:Alcohol dehydrogenase catalytic domain-containing protein n=1 Tax=Vibrio qingdaonensis TaxID=2829491 RepID=A0A9X3HWI1_9VIBR|nr:alcohol dehydrogenase catalytic domain-containing protein [Vibrio qingdaonensis]MCW8345817.1 alcohol dehydrogenase catalytic domain-containing protein [Vibrio qingdaonensis]